MKTQKLNMIHQYTLNLLIAHQGPLLEIHRRLANMVRFGKPIKKIKPTAIMPEAKEIYYYGDEASPVSEEIYESLGGA